MFNATTILFLLLRHFLPALSQANIPIHPISTVDEVAGEGYFSDPYHVPYENNQGIYIAGTTHKYMVCDDILTPTCAVFENNTYDTSAELRAHLPAGTHICSAAGIHPFQSGSNHTGSTDTRSWDAIVTFHLQKPTCNNDTSDITGWSAIVHARPTSTDVALPPQHWVGDTLLVGPFSPTDADDVDGIYDCKYFRTPAGELFLLYQKQLAKNAATKRDGVAALRMADPQTVAGSAAQFLLVPDDDLRSENYVAGQDYFKLIETGNIRAINGTFVMAYSVGAFDRKTYKAGVASADRFLGPYRKVMRNNPAGVWGTAGPKEVDYLLQAEEDRDVWRFVGDRVLAPGVPTGPDGRCS